MMADCNIKLDFPMQNLIARLLKKAEKTLSNTLEEVELEAILEKKITSSQRTINFENERLDGFSADDFDDILAVKAELTDKEGWFFFGEIQNVPLWENFCCRIADSKLHVFVTGSNARMLSREMERRCCKSLGF